MAIRTNADYERGMAASATVRVRDNDNPVPRTNVTVTEGHHAVRVNWAAPANGRGSAITAYQIEAGATIATTPSGWATSTDSVTGLSLDVRLRTLVVHQAEGVTERGMSISVSYNPTPSTPLGFTARVSPAWGGDSMSGAEALSGRESMAGMGHDPLMNRGGQHLDTEVGYGLPIGSRFVGTPRVGLRTSEYGRDYRIGYGMQVLEQGRLNLQLGIDAERRESPMLDGLGQGPERSGADQRVIGTASLGW